MIYVCVKNNIVIGCYTSIVDALQRQRYEGGSIYKCIPNTDEAELHNQNIKGGASTSQSISSPNNLC